MEPSNNAFVRSIRAILERERNSGGTVPLLFAEHESFGKRIGTLLKSGIRAALDIPAEDCPKA
jgi:hypothetical protein